MRLNAVRLDDTRREAKRLRDSVALRIYSAAYPTFGIAFAAYAWSHWGNWFTCWLWALAMFFGWPIWIVYHFVVLKAMP